MKKRLRHARAMTPRATPIPIPAFAPDDMAGEAVGVDVFVLVGDGGFVLEVGAEVGFEVGSDVELGRSEAWKLIWIIGA